MPILRVSSMCLSFASSHTQEMVLSSYVLGNETERRQPLSGQAEEVSIVEAGVPSPLSLA